MKKRQKQKRANLIMILIIAGIAAAGIAAAGFILGWFGNSSSAASLSDIRGIVNLSRNGVTYAVSEETELRAGDGIRCEAGGSAAIRIGEGSAIAIGQKADLIIEKEKDGEFTASVSAGELFAGADQDAVTLKFAEEEIVVQDAVISLSVQGGGASALNVYAGKAGPLSEGETVLWTAGKEERSELEIESLNAFAIAQLRGMNTLRQTCFSNEDLDALEARRSEEKAEAAQSVMAAEDEKDLTHKCTLTIDCRTILDNKDKLDPAKAEFVPEDGVVLAPTEVPFAEGETVFDVLQRACTAYDLQLEYSWTPIYDAYYIEGINHIYEFDCGSESGWMFKVNGWFPNYGCSSYTLEEGDDIVWNYTCVGLGVDIGAVGMGEGSGNG